MEINEYFKVVKKNLDLINQSEIQNFVDFILEAYNRNKMIFIIGNGGSASNATHLAEDLSKGTILDQFNDKRIRALSLTDNFSYISAISNDDGYDMIFESQLRTYALEGDCLIAISGSGNSKNIIKAVEFARKKKIKIFGVTGYDGGKLKKLSDFCIHIPLNEMCMVESMHSVIFHFVTTVIRKKLSGIELDDSYFSNCKTD
jgi:D-sedoheptulose 7-phosphate isomerase